jgi:hypothetical protein
MSSKKKTSVESSVEVFEFDHTPFYKTLTSSGISHFNRIADALAEFIDNSIQATSKRGKEIESRDISIALHLDDGYIGTVLYICSTTLYSYAS